MAETTALHPDHLDHPDQPDHPDNPDRRPPPSQPPPAPPAPPRIRTVLLEWLFIGLVVAVFCRPFLDLGSGNLLPGSQTASLQAQAWVLLHGLHDTGTIPAWNPYLQTGIPFLGDPTSFVLNPVVSLPIVALGVDDGFKVALFLSILAAALGMWLLALVLGMSLPARLWMALVFACTGQVAARFLQGQYNFVFALAWIPWSLAGLIGALEYGRRRYVVVAAVALALLVSSGSFDYTVLMVFVIALAAAVALVPARRPFAPSLAPVTSGISARRQVIILATVLGLALGLGAVRLWSLADFWGRLVPDTGLFLPHSQPPAETLANLLEPQSARAAGVGKAAPEETYAFVGHWIFFALLALPLVWLGRRRRVRRRWIAFFVAMAIGTVAWIDTSAMPWNNLFAGNPVLGGLQYPTRALVLAVIALVALSGLGLDALWASMAAMAGTTGTTGTPGSTGTTGATGTPGATGATGTPGSTGATGTLGTLGSTGTLGTPGATAMATTTANRRMLGFAGIAALMAFMVLTVADVFQTNQPFLQTREDSQEARTVLDWLRQKEPGAGYVSMPNGWHTAAAAGRMFFKDAWYEFNYHPDTEGGIGARSLGDRPEFVVAPKDAAAPADAERVGGVEDFAIYRNDEALPMAFVVPVSTLTATDIAGPLTKFGVTPLTAYWSGPDRVELIAQGDGAASALVVQAAAYPGWALSLDGRPAAVRKAGGFLAADLQAGIHKFVFAFQPDAVRWGWLITLLAWAVLLVMVLPEAMRVSRAALADLRGWTGALGRIGSRSGHGRIKVPGRAGTAGAAQPRIATTAEPAAPALMELDSSAKTGPDAVTTAEWNAAAMTGPNATPTAEPNAVARAARSPRAAAALAAIRTAAGTRSITLAGLLFVGSLALYLFTRLWHINLYPIYFFTDEAVQPLLAQKLLDLGLKDGYGHWFPLYFEADGNRWTPLLSVYFHAVTIALFGKSVFVARATSAVVSVLGVGAVAMILKRVFKVRLWWAGALLMAVMPAWFLHSRTAFETVMMTSFFACAVFFYLLYRTVSPRYIFPAVLFGGAAFYAYSNGQLVVIAATALFCLIDLPYHWRQRGYVLLASGLAVILATPLILFQRFAPTALQTHLRFINSYWFSAESLPEKLFEFGKRYVFGLSPQYWFVPGGPDIERHRMDSFGHIFVAMAPLILLGIIICLVNVRRPAYRTILLAALVTPVGGAMVDIGITRVLAFVVPAAIWAGLGLDWLLGRLTRRIPAWLVAASTFVVLAGCNLWLLNQALTYGSHWFTDFGLYGQQYGSEELFARRIPAILAKDPQDKVLVSSSWANAPDRFINFFLPPDQQPRVTINAVETFLFRRQTLDRHMVFVMTPSEYQKAKASPKFKDVAADSTMLYPDGSVGFYFVRLSYADNVDQVFADERLARQALVTETVQMDGQLVHVDHSQLDMGQFANLLDGNPMSLIRGLEANPLILDIHFTQPRPLRSATLSLATMDLTWTTALYAPGATEPVTYTQTFKGLPQDPTVSMNFDHGPPQVARMRIAITMLGAGEVANIHVRDLQVSEKLLGPGEGGTR